MKNKKSSLILASRKDIFCILYCYNGRYCVLDIYFQYIHISSTQVNEDWNLNFFNLFRVCCCNFSNLITKFDIFIGFILDF